MWRRGDPLLVDTSVVVHAFRGHEDVRLNIASASTLYLSIVSYGELLYGAEKSAQPAMRHLQLDAFEAACVLLPVDKEVAGCYHRLRLMTEKRGKPLPANDLWIAATAIAYSLPLYSEDHHFEDLSGLELVKHVR